MRHHQYQLSEETKAEKPILHPRSPLFQFAGAGITGPVEIEQSAPLFKS